jgi:hypothetical protein
LASFIPFVVALQVLVINVVSGSWLHDVTNNDMVIFYFLKGFLFQIVPQFYFIWRKSSMLMFFRNIYS